MPRNRVWRRWLWWTPLIALACSGCAQIMLDAQAAQSRATAAQRVGLLGPADPLPQCLAYLLGSFSSSETKSALSPPFAGLLDTAVALYILDSVTQAGTQSDTLDRQCGPVAIKLLKNSGRRAPGL